MLKTKTFFLLTVPALVLALTLSCGGKKEEADVEQFADMCQRAAQCDAQVKAQPNGEEICKKSMGLLLTKYPAKVDDMRKCVVDTPCEELSIGNCMAEMAKGLTLP